MPRTPQQSIPDLTSHLGYWLRYVSNHVSHAFARKLAARDVTVAEWAIMRELYGADRLAPSRLAKQLGLTRGAISKLADRLLAKGLATRSPDPADARAQILALTARGRSVLPKLAAIADANDAEYFAHLTAEERLMVVRVLKDIVRIQGLKSVPLN